MLHCRSCGKEAAPLILNTCQECDPELHAVFKVAIETSSAHRPLDVLTPELVTAYELLGQRKREFAVSEMIIKKAGL